jgi:carbonic anhydrase
VGAEHYQLTQFHFHHPSEEYIHGAPSDMEAHLMYQAGDGKVAGVAVLLKAGKANMTIQRIWDHMPRTESGILNDFSHQEISVTGAQIDPAGLLPRDLGYYTYEGSVTAPPCNENVTWFVLKSPVEISAGQIKAFDALYPHDVRPLQPLDGRVAKESE